MADIDRTPGLGNGNVPKLSGSGGGKNPFEKKN